MTYLPFPFTGTVMNDSLNSLKRADSPEPRLTRREPRSRSGVDDDPGGFRWAVRETSSMSPKPREPQTPRAPSPMSLSPTSLRDMGVDKICTHLVDFL